MLAEGEVDALIHSDIIKPIEAGDPRVGAAVAGLQGRGNPLLQEDAFSRSCTSWASAGDRRPPSLGAGQPVPGLREVQGHRHEADGQPAHRAARLVSARPGTSSRSILGPDPWEYGLDRQEPAQRRYDRRLFARAGADHEQWTADDLFVSVFQGRKRGDEWRI